MFARAATHDPAVAALAPPDAMRLPWTGRNVPHAVLDLLRDCDVRCPGCYNARSFPPKPLEQIRGELEALLAARRLHTVTLSGGEPLLHPQLAEHGRGA